MTTAVRTASLVYGASVDRRAHRPRFPGPPGQPGGGRRAAGRGRHGPFGCIQCEVRHGGRIRAAAVLAAFFRPVIVVTILFLTVYPSTITFGGISIQRLGGPLALLVAVAQLLRGGVHFRRPTLTLWLVPAYVRLAAASLSWTTSPSGTLHALAALGISLAYMAAVAIVLRSAGELRVVLWAVTLWSAVLGAWWIVSYALGESREFNALGDPNFFAALQVIAAPLAVCLFAHTASPM